MYLNERIQETRQQATGITQFGIAADVAENKIPDATQFQFLNPSWIRYVYKNSFPSIPGNINVLLVFTHEFDSGSAPIGSQDVNAWRSYVDNIYVPRLSQVVQQNAQIRAVQIWNEEDICPDSSYCPGMPAQAYAYMIKQAASAIKTRNGSIQVVMGGLGSGNPGYINSVRNADPTALNQVDAIGFHPYGKSPNGWSTDRLPFGDLGQTVDQYRAAASPAPVWVTEIGQGTQDRQWQADYLQRAFTVLIEKQVPVVIWYGWTDRMLGGDGQPTWGLYDSNGTTKPSGQMFATFTSGNPPPVSGFPTNPPITAGPTTPPIACPPTSSNSYDVLPVQAGPGGMHPDSDPVTHPDMNLDVRGWIGTNAPLQLHEYPGESDDIQQPPQLTTLLTRSVPTFTSTHQVYDWNWSTNTKGSPITTFIPTLAGIQTTPGETIRVPDSGYDVGGGRDVMVLFASPDSLTIKYTREDNVVNGYTIHLEGLCVDPNLLNMYRDWNTRSGAEWRHSLPALRGGEPLGIANSSEVKVAIRDNGNFLDPRSRKDWWQSLPPLTQPTLPPATNPTTPPGAPTQPPFNGTTKFQLTRNHQLTCEEQVSNGNKVRVFVRDENGNGIPNAQVYVWHDNPPFASSSHENFPPPPEIRTTDSNGFFEFNNSSPGCLGNDCTDNLPHMTRYFFRVLGTASDTAVEITSGIYGNGAECPGYNFCPGDNTKNVWGHWSYELVFRRTNTSEPPREVPTDHAGQLQNIPASAACSFPPHISTDYPHFYNVNTQNPTSTPPVGGPVTITPTPTRTVTPTTRPTIQPTTAPTAPTATSITNPPTVPNCDSLQGPTTIILGNTATYTARFSSPSGTELTGVINALKDGTPSPTNSSNWDWSIWPPSEIPNSNGTRSFSWTPDEAGRYQVFCRAWNAGTSECRGAINTVDGPPRYLCAGPNAAISVQVVRPEDAIPGPRTEMCQSASTIGGNIILPGRPVAIAAIAQPEFTIQHYSFGFGNLDNQFPIPSGYPSNPRPIYFSPNVSYTVTSPQNQILVRYEDVDKPDLNNNGIKPTRIQVNAYFTDSNGQTSQANSRCVVTLQVATPSPTPTVESAPTGQPQPPQDRTVLLSTLGVLLIAGIVAMNFFFN